MISLDRGYSKIAQLKLSDFYPGVSEIAARSQSKNPLTERIAAETSAGSQL